MGIMKKVGELISPNDPELVQKTIARLDEQDRWNDVFSTKLIELLDKNDELRSEFRRKAVRATADLNAAQDALVRAETLTAQAKSVYAEAIRRVTRVAVSTIAFLTAVCVWLFFFFPLRNAIPMWMPLTVTLLIGILAGVLVRRTK